MTKYDDLVKRLRMVTGFVRFETGDRIAASACLSEEAADAVEALQAEQSKARAEASARDAETIKAAEKLAVQAQRVRDFRYDPNVGIELNLLEEVLAAFRAAQEKTNDEV